MEDHLSQVISQCVTPHFKEFTIHRIPITGTKSESVLVVEFENSPLAPHQSKADTNYYYRIPGHSVPAPHDYLEYLRQRQTSVAFEIVDEPSFDLSFPLILTEKWRNQILLSVDMKMKLKNVSFRSADHCVLRVFADESENDWYIGNDDALLSDGMEISGSASPIHPTSEVDFDITFRTPVRSPTPFTWRSAWPIWRAFKLSLQVLSQDFAGEIKSFHPAMMLGENIAMVRLQRAIDRRQEEEQRLRENGKRLADGLRQNLGSMKGLFERH